MAYDGPLSTTIVSIDSSLYFLCFLLSKPHKYKTVLTLYRNVMPLPLFLMDLFVSDIFMW